MKSLIFAYCFVIFISFELVVYGAIIDTKLNHDMSMLGNELRVVKREAADINKTTTEKPTVSTTVTTKLVAKTTTTSVVDSSKNCTGNDTSCNGSKNEGLLNSTYRKIQENKDMLMRTFYVLLGVTGIVVLYFVVKAVRIRRRKSRTRRYGLLAGKGDKMEMTPLDQDDDDEEDITVFEMNGKRR